MSVSFAPLAFDSSERHAGVELLLRTGPNCQGSHDGVDLSIAADDEMLLDAVQRCLGDRDAALVLYFSSALDTHESLRQIVDWRYGGFGAFRESGANGKSGAMLDFGSGFGRLTRFLVREIDPSRLWVADIVPEAVAFQRERFGVRGLVSASRPEELRCSERFELVWVGSLFTHLPEARFRPWLERLLALTRPEGLLVFSTHDVVVMPPERTMPPSGLLFLSSSESLTLDTAEYGSTWVTAEYVARTLDALAPGRWLRLPRGLCDYQDLYLVARSGCEPSTLRYDAGPRFMVERCELLAPGELRLSGWAWAPSPGCRVEVVEASLDGEPLGTGRDFTPRPDLEGELGGHSAAAGWELRCTPPVPLRCDSALLSVWVRNRSGFRRLAYQGSIHGLLHRTARENWLRSRDRVLELEERIRAMRLSRFWRARTAWFRVKRLLRITDEE